MAICVVCCCLISVLALVGAKLQSSHKKRMLSTQPQPQPQQQQHIFSLTRLGQTNTTLNTAASRSDALKFDLPSYESFMMVKEAILAQTQTQTQVQDNNLPKYETLDILPSSHFEQS